MSTTSDTDPGSPVERLFQEYVEDGEAGGGDPDPAPWLARLETDAERDAFGRLVAGYRRVGGLLTGRLQAGVELGGR